MEPQFVILDPVDQMKFFSGSAQDCKDFLFNYCSKYETPFTILEVEKDNTENFKAIERKIDARTLIHDGKEFHLIQDEEFQLPLHCGLTLANAEQRVIEWDPRGEDIRYGITNPHFLHHFNRK